MTSSTTNAPWTLRAATVLLAFVFALPACFTTSVWRDHRGRDELLAVEQPALHVFRTRDESGEFVLQLPPNVAAHLHAVLPAIAADTQWLHVRPLEHTQTAATLLALATTTGSTNPRLQLTLLEEPAAPSSQMTFRAWVLLPWDTDVHRLPGFRRHVNGFITQYHLDIPCEATTLASRPTVLGEEVLSCTLTHERMRDDDTMLITRIALTPLAVIGDVVFLPFELMFGLMWFFST